MSSRKLWGPLLALALGWSLSGCEEALVGAAPPSSAWRWAQRAPAFEPPDSVSISLRSTTSVFSHRASIGQLELLSPLRGALRNELELGGVDWRRPEPGALHADVNVVDWTPATQQTMSRMIVLRTHVVVVEADQVLFEGELVGPPALVGQRIGQMLVRGGVPD